MYGLTVRDFCDMAIDSFHVAIFDNVSCEEVFNGNSSDIPYEYEDLEVEAFDPPTMYGDDIVLVIDVSIESDDDEES